MEERGKEFGRREGGEHGGEGVCKEDEEGERYHKAYQLCYCIHSNPAVRRPGVRQTHQYGMGLMSPIFISFNFSCKFRE